MQTIYLDNNATTQVDPEVVEAMLPFFTEKYGNPSSIHRFGGLIRRHVEQAREQVAGLIGAWPEEIYFTSCGSESDNMAIQGFVKQHRIKSRLVTSAVEHPAVRNTCRRQKEEHGIALEELPVDAQGLIDLEHFKSLPISPDTLVSLMWANNETGVLFPLEEIAEWVKSRGGSVHSDAVQAVGKMPIDMSTTPLDMLALSGHKLHAPKGVGALYLRKGVKLPALLQGGHQENGLRAGTENVAYIVGLGKACELAKKRIDNENNQVRKLRDKLENALLASCKGAKLNGAKELRLPNTTNISFEAIEGEAILLLLDENGIAASSGSACTTGSLEPSHVMLAMGLSYTYAHSSTRFSMSIFNTEEEIDKVIEVMPGIVERLRALSPFAI
ncbi:MAG: cysteine desulfurase NifS [Chitinivibrionales bacterium]|nr:cysteine desulfurase NifS [Chitinivibrionales bacterium]